MLRLYWECISLKTKYVSTSKKSLCTSFARTLLCHKNSLNYFLPNPTWWVDDSTACSPTKEAAHLPGDLSVPKIAKTHANDLLVLQSNNSHFKIEGVDPKWALPVIPTWHRRQNVLMRPSLWLRGYFCLLGLWMRSFSRFALPLFLSFFFHCSLQL